MRACVCVRVYVCVCVCARAHMCVCIINVYVCKGIKVNFNDLPTVYTISLPLIISIHVSYIWIHNHFFELLSESDSAKSLT